MSTPEYGTKDALARERDTLIRWHSGQIEDEAEIIAGMRREIEARQANIRGHQARRRALMEGQP